MIEHAAKKLSLIIRYVPDRYKTQEMCEKAILENGGTLVCPWLLQKSKNDVDNYVHALESVPDCYKTQELYVKAADTCPFVFNFVPDSLILSPW